MILPDHLGKGEPILSTVDLDAFLAAATGIVGRQTMSDAEFGATFRDLMRSLTRFDHVVVFAYRGKQRPIDLFATFGRDDYEIFVTLYQAGPYLLDPFYHTAAQRRTGVYRMRELAPDRFFSSEYHRSYYVKTGLAEEIGFFVPLEDEATVVLSLMRKLETGPFPVAEFALLRRAEPLVAKLVRHYWAGVGRRFDRRPRLAGDAGSASDPAGRAVEWRGSSLTARETAIVELVLQGHSSESIGLKLGIATGTVKVHRRNVYRKLGIASQTQLLSIYLRNVEA